MVTTALLPSRADAVQLFRSRADWQSAVDSLGLEQTSVDPFDNRIDPAETIRFESGISSTNDPFSPPNNSVRSGAYRNTVDGDADAGGASLITLLTPAPIRAFGVEILDAAPTGLQISGDFDGTGPIPPLEAYTALGDQPDGFLGLIGGADFTTILLSAGGNSSDAFRLDDLTTAAAPVPAPLPPLGGAAALAFARRLRSRIARSAPAVKRRGSA